MGTRNLTAVFMDGEYKVAQYGQWDGYPSGQGVTILDFLKNTQKFAFKNKLKNVRFLSKQELIEIDSKHGADWINIYPHLSRDVGGEILQAIMDGAKELKNSISFAGESLFCEYAYVIDLDNDTFEVFEGFNKKELDEFERFYSFKKVHDDYCQVRLVHKFDLDKLPTEKEFLDILEPEDGEE